MYLYRLIYSVLLISALFWQADLVSASQQNAFAPAGYYLVAQSQVIKSTCSRLEGVKMPCTGSGGYITCDSCPPGMSENSNSCGAQSQISCDDGSTRDCFACCFQDQCTESYKNSFCGTRMKCGQACVGNLTFEGECTDAYKATFCGTRQVCGQACVGTAPPSCGGTCYKIEDSSYTRNIIGDAIEECHDETTYSCSGATVSGDGCTCSCPSVVNGAGQCVPNQSGTSCPANPICSCQEGQETNEVCEVTGYMCDGVETIACKRVIDTKPSIPDPDSTCGCKCPDGYSPTPPANQCGSNQSCTPGQPI